MILWGGFPACGFETQEIILSLLNTGPENGQPSPHRYYSVIPHLIHIIRSL